MLAAVALGNTATGLAAKVPKLPGAMQAVAQAETQVGIRLAAVGEVDAVVVSAEAVTISLAPNAVAMSAGGGRDTGHVTGELTRGASDIPVDKVVNSNMPHAAELADLMGSYEGPDVVLDFGQDGILVGIEVVACYPRPMWRRSAGRVPE